MATPSIPYMGSKSKLASRILDVIQSRHPSAENFHDLFGGGAAVSVEATIRGAYKSVHYNELDTGVAELFRKVITDGVTDEFYRWIDRDEFFARNKEDSWFGGLIKTCWSFGSRGASYIYGHKVVDAKKQLHDLVVNRIEIPGLEIHPDIMAIEDVQERRLSVMRVVKKIRGRVGLGHLECVNRLQHLECVNRLQHLKSVNQLQHLERVNRLEHLERVNHLQHLERVNRLEQITVTNQSAFDFTDFGPDDVVYLDPPYEGTEKYQNDICHQEFKKFVLSLPCPVYVSSYNIDWLECVAEFSHRSRLSSCANNKVVERLYYKP